MTIPNKSKQNVLGKKEILMLLSGLGLLVIFVFFGFYFQPKPIDVVNTGSSNSAIKVTDERFLSVDLEKLISDFEQNQQEALVKYSQKTVVTEGYVGSVSVDTRSIHLIPKYEKFFWGTNIKCYFDQKARFINIEEAEAVKIVGKVTGMEEGNVILENCYIAK